MKLLILGGGPAGLAAAWYAKGIGINDITIVEREERIGGCSKTNFYEGIPYEFGPQILYTDEADIQQVIERFVTNTKPPSEDGEFHPKVFPYGTIEDPHDFPVTVANVLKIKEPGKAIYELYKINLDKPDFSNFENYMLSRVGKTLYETYVRNYNLKQWKMDPKDMDAEWARLRTMTLREKNDMFQGRWQGHPGDYTPLWDGLLKESGAKVIVGEASISEDMKKAFVDGKEVEADIIISTLPLGKDFKYIHVFEVFVGVKNSGFVMPSYTNSFPNDYNFTRILDYKQQFFVKSDYSLLSFSFPFDDESKLDKEERMKEAQHFVKNVLKMEPTKVWFEMRKQIYPIPSATSVDLLEKKLKLASENKIIPFGRCGVYAYVSKDVCFRMARIVTQNIDKVMAGGEGKLEVLHALRAKLR